MRISAIRSTASSIDIHWRFHVAEVVTVSYSLKEPFLL